MARATADPAKALIDWAETLARSLGPRWGSRHLAAVAGAHARRDDMERARDAAAEAARRVEPGADPSRRASDLLRVAEANVWITEPDEAELRHGPLLAGPGEVPPGRRPGRRGQIPRREVPDLPDLARAEQSDALLELAHKRL